MASNTRDAVARRARIPVEMERGDDRRALQPSHGQTWTWALALDQTARAAALRQRLGR